MKVTESKGSILMMMTLEGYFITCQLNQQNNNSRMNFRKYSTDFYGFACTDPFFDEEKETHSVRYSELKLKT